MGRPPHEIRNERRERDEDYFARREQLEAQYGLPINKIPGVLQRPPAAHPQHARARRYRNRARDSRRISVTARFAQRQGWRELRAQYLRELEQRRLAEIQVRQQLAKVTGRSRRVDRKAHVHIRERIEANEWRREH